MMNAYDRIYLERARTSFGRMLDYAVHDLGFELKEYWELFLGSPVCSQFETGNVSVLTGRSGIELALMVAERDSDYPSPKFTVGRSEEYWTGWALAYVQWQTGLGFAEITEFVPIEEVRMMYMPYHEMDVRQFCDKVLELYHERKGQTNLKRRRLEAGISQSELAEMTGIPVRTIQQYEQRQKDINRARAEYVIALARALYCRPEKLMEV